MRFIQTILLASTVGMVTAAPTSDNTATPTEDAQVDVSAPPVSIKDVISARLCTNSDWKGCTIRTITTQTKCQSLAGSNLNNNVASIKVPDGYRCRFWDSTACNGKSTPDIYAPGSKQLPSNMHGKASSFKCYKN